MSPQSMDSVISGTVVVLVALSLTGCGHEPVRRLDSGSSAPAAVTTTPQTAGQQAAAIALGQVGVPYRYGGANPHGFDCSGLTQFAHARAGQRIPRTTAEQWRSLSPVPKGALTVGDVVFFRIEGAVSHVGLYLGDDRFVHAPASGRRVEIERLDTPFYAQAFVRGGRP